MCGLKGVAPEIATVDFRADGQRSPDYLAVAPSGLVPTLADDDGFTLSQSLAIALHLEALYPDPPLVPRDHVAAMRAWELALIVACDIHPLNNLRVLRYLTDQGDLDEDWRDRWYRHWVSLGFEAMEARVAVIGGLFCVGDAVTLADVCLVPQMFNARRYNVDLAPYARLVDIDARLREIPAFAAAAPA